MTVKTEASEFDKLLNEIGDMHKALPSDGDTAKDDAKIEEAADEGDADEADEADEGKDDKVMTKSFKLKLDDGTEVDAMDGSELIKSLTERVEKNETSFTGALRQVLDIVKSQAETINKLASAGKGRKAVVTVAEKKVAEDINKSEKSEMGGAEFLAKSMQAFTAGKITGHDVRLAETFINQGKAPPDRIVRAVMGQ